MTELDQEIVAAMGDETTDAEPDTLQHPEGAPVSAADDAAPDAEPGPRSQADIEALNEKLRKEAERHEKRVSEIMGDDFALLVRSPVDWTPGYIFNVPEMWPTPDDVAALHALLGEAQRIELNVAEDAEACDKCGGLGDVLTGSRKPGQETKPCTACSGAGWRTKAIQTQPLAAVPIYTTPERGTSNLPNQFPVADRWGRPFGHPHYNMEPASVG